MSAAGGLVRRLRREPGLSVAVIATLGLGVGATTALAVYLASFAVTRLPARDPGRLVHVHLGTAEEPTASASYAEYRAVATSGAFEEVAANQPSGATVTHGGVSRFAWGQAVTSSYFPLFAARPALGRLLLASDDAGNETAPVVLSHRLWRELFGADSRALGETVTLNGSPHVVVGVTERTFQGVGFASEWFVPLAEIDRLTGLARLEDPSAKFLFLWALVPPGRGGAERAESALGAVAAGLDAEAPLPDGARRIASLRPATLFGSTDSEDPYYLAARALAVAAILFLLLGAGNVSGLLLARATARDQEWAVRRALGAGPGRLLAAQLAEIGPLVVLGLVAAAAVATAILRWIEAAVVNPVGGLGSTWAIEETAFLHLDLRAAGVALAVTLVSVAIAVAAPIARVVRRPPARALGTGAGRSGTDRATLAPRRLLVVSELALAVLLLVAGALLVRTLGAYADADPGFDTHGLTLAAVYLPPTANGASESAAFYRALVERVRAEPGVAGATLASVGPNSGWARSLRASPAEAPEGGVSAAYNIVDPGYLRTLGVPLLSGRDLGPGDDGDSPPVAVVSRALATAIWGDPSRALGRRVHLDLPARPGQLGPEFEVVGVSADAGVTSPAEPARPWVFLAYGQRVFSRMQLVVRSALPPAELEPRLRDALGALRADASLIDVVPASEQLRRALQSPRLNAQIAGGLAFAGLATALLGLVALQTFTVRLRRRDLAVRMALGATGRRVAREVVAESLRLAAAGLALGVAAALAAMRLLRGVLFGVGPADLASFVGVPLLLGAAVLLASWLPARRAARVDPARNLRAL